MRTAALRQRSLTQQKALDSLQRATRDHLGSTLFQLIHQAAQAAAIGSLDKLTCTSAALTDSLQACPNRPEPPHRSIHLQTSQTSSENSAGSPHHQPGIFQPSSPQPIYFQRCHQSTAYAADSTSRRCGRPLAAATAPVPAALTTQSARFSSSGPSLRRTSSAIANYQAVGLPSFQDLLQSYRKNLGSVTTAVGRLTQGLLKGQKAADDESDSAAHDAAVHVLQSSDDLVQLVGRADQQQLALTITAIAAGETKTTTEALEAITRQLENLLRSADFDPYANSQILQALSVLGYQPEPRFLDIVARRALAELQAGSLENASEGCVQLVGALAVHRHNHNEFMQAVGDHLSSKGRINQKPIQLLSEAMWAYAVLGCHHRRMVDCIMQRVLYQIKNCPPTVLSQLVCSLAVLGHKDAITDVFLGAVSDEAVRCIGKFSAEDLCNIVWAAASVGHGSMIEAELMETVIRRLVLLESHKNLDARSIVNLVWSIAKADHQSPKLEELLDNLASESLQHLDEFTPEQLSRLLWAFCVLRHYAEDVWIAVAHKVQPRLHEFQAHELSDLLLGYASMVHHPGVLMPHMANAIKNNMDDMQGHALCCAIWAMAVLRTLTPELFEEACSKLENRSLSEFEPQDFERAFHAEMMLEAESSRLRLPKVKLPEWIRTYAARAWQDRVYLERTVSPLQVEVCRTLGELGINFELEKTSEDGCFSVDIVLLVPDRPKLAIKADPPSKFTSNRPYRPLADAVITWRLLASQGWNLITVAKHDWRLHRTQAAKAEYLQSRMAESQQLIVSKDSKLKEGSERVGHIDAKSTMEAKMIETFSA